MSDTLLYAWSSMLFSDHSDLYPGRRMSDSALSADSASATTATDPDSPTTEPDILHPDLLHHPRKPSLPGIGALTPLLDPADPLSFPRRASLPTLASDLSLRASPRPSPLAFRPRTYDQPPPLASYAFPAPASPDPAFGEPPFSSPFTSPLSPEYSPARMDGAAYPSQLSWGAPPPTSPTPTSPPRTTPKRRRSPNTPPAQTPSQTQPPPSADQQPQRRPRGKLPKHTTDLLKEWLHAHSDHPYPSEDEKRDLCARTKLSMSQVSNWMINARRRILAPAKPPIVSATTTEPYRLAAAHSRPIGSLYAHPAHMYAAAPPPPPGLMRRVASEDSLRLYEPAGYPHPAHLPHQEYPRYAATTQPMYATSAGGGGAMSAHAHTHVAHHPHAASLGLGLMGGPERRLAYPAATVGVAGMGDTYGHAAHGTPGGSPQGYGGPPIYLPTPGSQAGEAGEGAGGHGEQQLVGAAEQPLHHDGQEDQRNGRYFAESTV